MRKLQYFLGITAALLLTACGDSPSRSKPYDASIFDQVDDFEDLGSCNKKHYGEVFLVLNTDTIYQCTSQGWVVADSSVIEEYYANQSSDSKGESSRSSSSFTATSSDTQKIEATKVDSIEINGFAQLGPFLSGTSVVVNGMDSALGLTKVKFSGKVSGDSGHYVISNVSFDNQFAQVRVTGFFYNLVKGTKTSGTKTKLEAIADLSEGKDINVNIFTSLEQARVMKLVKDDGYNVPAAKNRAFKELMAFFGTGFAGSKVKEDVLSKMSATDLNLSDTTQMGAALIAATVMTQENLSLSALASNIEDLAEDFAENGSIKDLSIRAEIADYLSSRNEQDGFHQIREYLKNLNVSSKIPDFESILNAFWMEEYGLPECNESQETKIIKNKNEKSDNYNAGYACTSNRWHKTSELDTELGLCIASKEGEYKESKLEKSPKYYVCKAGTWNEISKVAYDLKACDEKKDGNYVAAESGEKFLCKDKQWLGLDNVSYELKLCTEDRNEEVKKTKDGNFYVCLEEDWKNASELDYTIGSPCLPKYLNNRQEAGSKYYSCKRDGWIEISEDVYNMGNCFAKTEGVCGVAESGKYYECSPKNDYSWIEIDEISCEVGTCGDMRKNEAVLYKGDSYFCNGSDWDVCNAENTNKLNSTGTMACIDSTANGEQAFIWREASSKEKTAKAVCNENLKEKSSADWIYTSNKTSAIYCVDHCDEYMCMEGIHEYQWVSADAGELATGVRCKSKISGTVSNGFACSWDMEERLYLWREASEIEIAAKKICDGNSIYTLSNGYVCDFNSDGAYEWRSPNKYESATKAVCNSSLVGKSKSAGDNTYNCKANNDNTKFYWTLTVTDTRTAAYTKNYEAVLIGNLQWLTSNLNYGTYDKTGSDDASGTKYGRFYEYSRVQSGSICPTGWRIPDPLDIARLQGFFNNNGKEITAGLLNDKEWSSSFGGTNDYGFNGIPSGHMELCNEEVSKIISALCPTATSTIIKRNNLSFWIYDSTSPSSPKYVILRVNEKIPTYVEITEPSIVKTSSGTQVNALPAIHPVRCVKD